ncbi:MAG: phosphopantetheine-binding protein [Alphaproteobacteria bacterium]|nr:phosphopantetheine-binding protein [Alphaproteobacteria bacterium]
MTRDEIIVKIRGSIDRILRDKGSEPAAVDADTPLIGGDIAIDSLDLATIVVELETETGKDPFAAGFVNFATVGELADLYV